jgi:hypothetical protein
MIRGWSTRFLKKILEGRVLRGCENLFGRVGLFGGFISFF